MIASNSRMSIIIIRNKGISKAATSGKHTGNCKKGKERREDTVHTGQKATIKAMCRVKSPESVREKHRG